MLQYNTLKINTAKWTVYSITNVHDLHQRVLTFPSVLTNTKRKIRMVSNSKTNIPQQPQSVQQSQVPLGNHVPVSVLQLVLCVQICETSLVNLQSHTVTCYGRKWVTMAHSEQEFTAIFYYNGINCHQCFVQVGLVKNATPETYNH